MMEEKPPISNSSHSPTEIKKTIYESLQQIASLRNLCQSSLPNLSTMSQDQKHELLNQCNQLRRNVEEKTELLNTPSKKIEIINKLLRAERKKRWRLKRRRIQRVQKTFFRSILAERNRQIDLWKQEREKQIESEVKEEQLQNCIIDKETQIKQLSRKKYEIQKLLSSLHVLYSKRLEKLTKQGYKPSYHPSIEEEGLLQTATNEVLQYKEIVVSEKKKREWIHKESMKEESDDEYYNGANHNISKLIAIRRAWDAYLVPSGHGSRIPTHFVDPPTREWL